MLKKSKNHLEKSQETYRSHLIWAICIGFKLIWTGITSVVHGLIPALFQGNSAKTIIDLYYKRLENHPNREYQDYINKYKKN